jgi:hypothetical protein
MLKKVQKINPNVHLNIANRDFRSTLSDSYFDKTMED